MKKLLLVLFVLAAIPVLRAQNPGDRVIYLDSLWKETTKGNHQYYRVIKDYDSTLDSYELSDYYQSGQLQMRGNVLDKITLQKTGEFTYYYKSGAKKAVAHFERSLHIGNYTEWYENGQKLLEAEYFRNEKFPRQEGEMKVYNFWTLDNTQTVANGNGMFKEISEGTEASGPIENGSRHGIWVGHNDAVGYSFTEEYQKGQLISGVSTDSEGKKHEYTQVRLMPQPKKGVEHFYKYIAKEFNIPRNEKVGGKIFLSFVIGKDGDAEEIKILRGLSPELDKEAIRVIKKYPDWRGGEVRGIPARILFSIPLNIMP